MNEYEKSAFRRGCALFVEENKVKITKIPLSFRMV